MARVIPAWPLLAWILRRGWRRRIRTRLLLLRGLRVAARLRILRVARRRRGRWRVGARLPRQTALRRHARIHRLLILWRQPAILSLANQSAERDDTRAEADPGEEQENEKADADPNRDVTQVGRRNVGVRIARRRILEGGERQREQNDDGGDGVDQKTQRGDDQPGDRPRPRPPDLPRG